MALPILLEVDERPNCVALWTILAVYAFVHHLAVAHPYNNMLSNISDLLTTNRKWLLIVTE